MGPASAHVLISQMTAERFTPLHTDGPEAVNPVSQTGWQLNPDCSVPLQFPTEPFAGGSDALHCGNRQSARPSTLPCMNRIPYKT
jgi:hypothetical protein